MKVAVEMIEALRYKLRWFGIPLDPATSIYRDNEAVCNSARTPESTLKKKHNSIASSNTSLCIVLVRRRIPDVTWLSSGLGEFPGRKLDVAPTPNNTRG
jgi:hypothetical protein